MTDKKIPSESIGLASDHRGVQLKRELIDFLKSKGVSVTDFGPNSDTSVDYPDYAIRVAEAVSRGEVKQGIVICHTGIGVSVSANKVKGVRAALCHNPEQGELARRHTDANVLALPAGFIDSKQAKVIVERWLSAKFEHGRHEQRIEKIKAYERKG